MKLRESDTYTKLGALGDLYGYLPQRVVIEPQLLQVGQLTYLGAQLDYVVEGQVQACEITHLEHLSRVLEVR